MINVIESFLELLYPEKNICQICNVYDNNINDKYICDSCLKKLETIQGTTCKICNKGISHNPDLVICEECARDTKSFEMSKSPFYYKGTIKKLIHDYKYCNQTYYYKLFGYLLVQHMKDKDYTNFDYIMSVPLHKIKLRKRGYNQSKLLAKYIEKHFDISYIDVLKRVHNTEKQSNLSKHARQRNLQNAFAIKNNRVIKLIEGKNILIIDDIFTTGTTINECSKILKFHGANKVYSLTLAR